MRVALAQLVSGADPFANLDLVAEAARAAADQRADLLLCPEATMRCFGLPLVEIAEPSDGPWATRLADIATTHGLVIAAGMFTPAGDGRVRNTLRVVGPGVDAGYDKIHLYDAFGFAESDTVAPGTELLVVEIGGVAVGLAICYDVRFPALFTALADRGAPADLRAGVLGRGTHQDRAVGPVDPGARAGQHLLHRRRRPGRPGDDRGADAGSAPTGIGHTLVVSPAGDVVASLGAEPGLLVVDLDPTEVETVRRAIPVLANRRL